MTDDDLVVKRHVTAADKLANDFVTVTTRNYERAINGALGTILIVNDQDVMQVKDRMCSAVSYLTASLIGSTMQSSSQELEDIVVKSIRQLFAEQREHEIRHLVGHVPPKERISS